ncbi:hypothetical protein CL617_05015 [archaeon]|jgi:hypothetical protein|nr:hypothetical protein [archaeon]|tara:strand:- start:56 stop:241 length:186 start_codon:yes stop_codon:yes gene_type:complete
MENQFKLKVIESITLTGLEIEVEKFVNDLTEKSIESKREYKVTHIPLGERHYTCFIEYSEK